MNVVFRVDSSIAMGAGHVVRCLTLAEEFFNRGATITFITRLHMGNLNFLIREKQYRLYELPLDKNATHDKKSIYSGWLGTSWQYDAESVSEIVKQIKPEILFIDHYAIDDKWETKVKNECGKLIVIDDLANRSHACDMLIDQTCGRRSEAYASYVDKDCLCLLGSEYAILRQEFAELRHYSLKRRQLPSYNKILISLGGVDADNVTAEVLEVLTCCDLPVDLEVTVVVGHRSPHKHSLFDLADKLPYSIKVLTGVNNMAEVMADSDLAIGAAGSSAWERCCLGLPAIMLIVAENQMTIARNLSKKGGAILLEKPIEGNLIKLFSGDIYNQLNDVSTNSALLVDGLGVNRIAESVFRL